MKVRFYATLRPIVGGHSIDVPIEPDTSLWVLLDRLIAQYPDLRPQLLAGDRELGHHIHVILNGRDAPYLERGMDTVLAADDRVDIFPPVGGG